MLDIKGLEWTFDTKASLYEKMRPGYVDNLYQTIFNYISVNEFSNVVEVGIGAGQATLPILQTGCQLTAVEYGKNFSELCMGKFKDFKNFSVITGKFEDIEFKDNDYDFVYSASAFHWIPEEIGYTKVFSMLRSGGVFARFANHPYRAKDNPALTAEIDKLYGLYYYKFYNKEQEYPKEYTKEIALYRAQISQKYGFKDIRYAMFNRVRTFTAKEYIMLISTYSDHVAMEETIRTEFFAKIEEAIEKHGGKINIFDTMDLQLARKP